MTARTQREPLSLENVEGFSGTGSRSLGIKFTGVTKGRTARVGTPTFIPSREVAEYFERARLRSARFPLALPGPDNPRRGALRPGQRPSA